MIIYIYIFYPLQHKVQLSKVRTKCSMKIRSAVNYYHHLFLLHYFYYCYNATDCCCLLCLFWILHCFIALLVWLICQKWKWTVIKNGFEWAHLIGMLCRTKLAWSSKKTKFQWYQLTTLHWDLLTVPLWHHHTKLLKHWWLAMVLYWSLEYPAKYDWFWLITRCHIQLSYLL